MIRLYNADSIKIINQFQSNNLHVNHIITDPPYGISHQNYLNTMNGHRQGVNFGKWDYDFNQLSWIKPYLRLLNRGGSFIEFASWRKISYIANYLEKQGMMIKDLLKWIKDNPMPRNIMRRYVVDTEFAIWATKPGAKWVFNNPKSQGYLRPEFHTPVVNGKEKTRHPTQKSLQLMKDIIRIHTKPNDLVIDPFMGSGTTGVACLLLHRNFIGVEINPKYFRMAEDRIMNIGANKYVEFNDVSHSGRWHKSVKKNKNAVLRQRKYVLRYYIKKNRNNPRSKYYQSIKCTTK